MDAVDSYIDSPVREMDKPFLMAVEDVFTITGRGTVATGKVERGQVKLNEEVEIVGYRPEPKKTVVTGIEMFNKNLQSAMAGDNAGVLLRGVDRKDIERGQVIAKPKTIIPHTKFKAAIYAPKKKKRKTYSIFQKITNLNFISVQLMLLVELNLKLAVKW